jgi:hypothetical protein
MTTWKITVTTSSGDKLEHESTSFHSAVGWASLAMIGRAWADDRVTITIDRDEVGKVEVDDSVSDDDFEELMNAV